MLFLWTSFFFILQLLLCNSGYVDTKELTAKFIAKKYFKNRFEHFHHATGPMYEQYEKDLFRIRNYLVHEIAVVPEVIGTLLLDSVIDKMRNLVICFSHRCNSQSYDDLMDIYIFEVVGEPSKKLDADFCGTMVTHLVVVNRKIKYFNISMLDTYSNLTEFNNYYLKNQDCDDWPHNVLNF